jgi:hypothetical protein
VTLHSSAASVSLSFEVVSIRAATDSVGVLTSRVLAGFTHIDWAKIGVGGLISTNFLELKVLTGLDLIDIEINRPTLVIGLDSVTNSSECVSSNSPIHVQEWPIISNRYTAQWYWAQNQYRGLRPIAIVPPIRGGSVCDLSLRDISV